MKRTVVSICMIVFLGSELIVSASGETVKSQSMEDLKKEFDDAKTEYDKSLKKETDESKKLVLAYTYKKELDRIRGELKKVSEDSRTVAIKLQRQIETLAILSGDIAKLRQVARSLSEPKDEREFLKTMQTLESEGIHGCSNTSSVQSSPLYACKKLPQKMHAKDWVEGAPHPVTQKTIKTFLSGRVIEMKDRRDKREESLTKSRDKFNELYKPKVTATDDMIDEIAASIEIPLSSQDFDKALAELPQESQDLTKLIDSLLTQEQKKFHLFFVSYSKLSDKLKGNKETLDSIEAELSTDFQDTMAGKYISEEIKKAQIELQGKLNEAVCSTSEDKTALCLPDASGSDGS